MRTRISGRWVVGSDGERHRLIENGCVVFSGNRIEYVGKRFDGPVDREIEAGDALIAPGFIDLDALFDLDTTVLGFDNQPGWKKGRIWSTDYVANGPVETYSADEEAFQHRYAMAQLLLGGITTALPIRSLLYREWAESYEENARAADDAAALGLRIYLGPSYRTGYGTVDETGTLGIHWDEARGEQRSGRGHSLRARFRRRAWGIDSRVPATGPDRILHRNAADPHPGRWHRAGMPGAVALLPGNARAPHRG